MIRHRTRFSLLAAAFFWLLLGTQAHAQIGCVDSPENPTAVLAFAGILGAAATRALSRIRRR